MRRNIIDDLNIDNNIIEPLTSNGILKTEDIRIIYTGASNEERAEKLLDILPRYVYIFLFCICTCFIHSYIYMFLF